MTSEERDKRIREVYLEELKEYEPTWFYISMARPEKFEGGFLVRTMGPTHALMTVHRMGWFSPGCETQTVESSDDEAARIPDDMKWRKLSREEALSLDKYIEG